MKVCWSKCFGHSDAGDQGKEGERDDDKGHFLAEQGKEDLLQRSLPQVKNLCVHLVHSIIDNLMARCVARNPKEMMRQVAAAKELDSAKVGEVFKPESLLISSCRYSGVNLVQPNMEELISQLLFGLKFWRSLKRQ